jgi:peptidyl-prolyl cis-trans isomerase B (cyclophilin B)
MTDVKQQVKDIEKTIDFSRNRYQVNMTTNHGPIHLEMFSDVAPGHVKNIVALTKAGYYNGLTFHRIIKGFMIQGGCPKGSGIGGPGYTINAEFNNRPHEPGVLSMARTNDPNSAGSQFFICLERVPYLDGQYTVFGRTVDKESLETVKKIGEVKTGPQDRPIDPVTITKAEVVETPL